MNKIKLLLKIKNKRIAILDKELLFWTKNFIEKYKKVLLSLAKK